MPQPVTSLPVDVAAQPDATTCGPTCLDAVYRFFGDEIPLSQVIGEVTPLPGGGTLAVWLACHALSRGYDSTLYTYNLQLFDPTWFPGTPESLAERLHTQREVKSDAKLEMATQAYIEFLSLGGIVRFEELTSELVVSHLRRSIPLLTGLSATYLYECAREIGDDYDDIRGEPVGHFVVVTGYDAASDEALVADPLHDNPGFESPYYRVRMSRLLGAILLGIVSYDANLLAISPRERGTPAPWSHS